MPFLRSNFFGGKSLLIVNHVKLKDDLGFASN